MDGMLLALCDHGFERSGLCAVNINNRGDIGKLTYSIAIRYILSSSARGTYFISVQYNTVQYHSNNCIDSQCNRTILQNNMSYSVEHRSL